MTQFIDFIIFVVVAFVMVRLIMGLISPKIALSNIKHYSALAHKTSISDKKVKNHERT